ncbi:MULTISPECIES: aspartate aminotransferase family protein [unclassified Planococcus (in: firmicutes)]|uniref:aspartate aminotransferase family protein n=1 Tax=Planococcus TaxID=1372 RepID=UPI000C7B54DE|nr:MULTISPECIES: aspartate aminotransferase family protein [unclassified Planococcus (in: firmicutes)]PKG45457.1 aspartate aminotransferase family protein [Planococcus sp. Urea-trap-24]PKG88946.1 aspartate aminotransferase family protein [Planococcus sp. Urea-3u-39]PKH36314.1 aspartate aminotransferase family protein [Planococcus sp. MB-3u-09]
MKSAKEKALTLAEKDKENLWHQISSYNEKKRPMVVEKGEGAWITDHEGNRYLDGMSGLWCVNVGYGRAELADAAAEQMKKLAYVPMTQSHEPAILLAEKLNELLGGEYKIFYSNSGSDANEVAFKLVRQYHQQNGEPSRFKFISRYRAYHGSSMGALSATGQALRKYKYEPLSPGFLHVAPPDNYRRPPGQSVEDYNLQRAQEFEEKIIWEQKETIAGIIMEPLITGGGILIPHPVYVEKVQEICKRHGVLLIIDEVICGFGRTGKAFGHQHFNIKPDIITMAKGMTSAYLPLSVTAIRKDIYDQFDTEEENSHFRHINTFGGNPAACAVALKNIEIIERESLIERSSELGERLLKELANLTEHPYVGDVRGLGFLLGIELVENKETKEPATAERVAKIINGCKEHGLIIGKNGDTVAGFNNVLTISPPLSSTDEDFEFIVAVLQKVFKENE